MKKTITLFIMLFAFITTMFGYTPSEKIIYKFNNNINKVICNLQANVKICEDDSTYCIIKGNEEFIHNITYNIDEEGVLTLSTPKKIDYMDNPILIKIGTTIQEPKKIINISTTRNDLIITNTNKKRTYEKSKN